MLVTVIIPAYNAAAYIAETIASVKGQTYPHWECIVVNDGSTDDTRKIVSEQINGDLRFSCIDQKNAGLSAARNTGLEKARGEFIQFLDADDILLPSKLEVQLADRPANATETAGNPLVLYTDYSTGRSTDIYRPADYYRSAQFHTDDALLELITRWESSLTIPPHCFLFSASFFRENNIRFDPALPNHEDFDCWVTIFRRNPSVKYIDKKLCIYRFTDGSMSKNMRAMGDGFLQVIDKQLHTAQQPPAIKRALIKKRRETLKRYNRIDKMSLWDKTLLIRHLLNYYSKTICSRLFGKAA